MQLDVEVAHPEGPPHRLAGHREDLGQGVVEGGLEPLVLASSGGPWPAPGGARGRGGRARPASGRRAAAIAAISARISAKRARISSSESACDLGLERVRLVDEGLDPLELAVVRVDEAGEEAQTMAGQYRRGAPSEAAAPA